MKFVNFLKSRLIFNIFYCSECLQTNFSHISRAHISKSKRCFNVKSSTCYFQMKAKILSDFQICIVYHQGEWEEGRATILKQNYIFSGYYFKLSNHVCRTFFLFFIKNRGESRLSPPSFGNIPWERGWKNKSTWLNIKRIRFKIQWFQGFYP